MYIVRPDPVCTYFYCQAEKSDMLTRRYIQGRLTMSKELIGIIGLFISLTVATASVIGVVQAGDSELRADMRIMQSQINDLQQRMSRVETKLDIAFTDATETAR